jgi:hypothetical protein
MDPKSPKSPKFPKTLLDHSGFSMGSVFFVLRRLFKVSRMEKLLKILACDIVQHMLKNRGDYMNAFFETQSLRVFSPIL